MMEDTNVGPAAGANGHHHSATAAEILNAQVNLDLDVISVELHGVSITDQPAGPVNQAGQANIQGDGIAQPEFHIDEGAVLGLVIFMVDGDESGIHDAADEPQHDNLPQYENAPEYDNNDNNNHGLPHIYTVDGQLAGLTTEVHKFRTWDEYKLICLAGPKISLVFEEAGGEIEFICARKLLRDFSETFKTMDRMVGVDRLNVTELFKNLAVKSATITFIQLYEMVQAGGLPIPASGDLSFAAMVDLYVMAHFLGMPCIGGWVETFAKAKIQELTANWMRDYNTAIMLQNVPEDRHNNGRFPIPALAPLQLQTAKLLDIQEAYMQTRFNPLPKVVLPSQLARLVSDSCPLELRFGLEAAGQLRPEFLAAVSMHDLRHRVEARQAANVGEQN